MTHAEMCRLAHAWLLRPHSRDGHGCSIAFTECKSGWTGEMPDAIGFRASEDIPTSVVVEVKVSRADFLADASKPHRQPGQGMGLYRYYMAPAGLIHARELPDRWGLLEVTPKGAIKHGDSAFVRRERLRQSGRAPCPMFSTFLEPFEHPRDFHREIWLLTRMLTNVGDPQKVRKSLQDAYQAKDILAKKCDSLSQEVERLKIALFNEKHKHHLDEQQ